MHAAALRLLIDGNRLVVTARVVDGSLFVRTCLLRVDYTNGDVRTSLRSLSAPCQKSLSHRLSVNKMSCKYRQSCNAEIGRAVHRVPVT